MRVFVRLSFGTKLNVLFLAVLLLLSSSIFFIAQKQLEMSIKESALVKAKSDLTLGYSYLSQKYPGSWTVRDNALYKGSTKISENYELVDEIGQLTGGDTVTIFLGDTRVATNVMKDGQRAIGTKVSDKVAEAVLKQGQIYLGEANVVGQWYQAAYQPIQNENGETIGIWYVGAEQSMIDKAQTRFSTIFGGTLAVTLSLAILVVIWFVRRLKKRLGRITEALERAGNGDFTRLVTDDSHDDIGQIGKSYNQMSTRLNELIRQVTRTSHEIASSAENLSASSEQISQATQHISGNVSEVAIGAEVQVHNVESGLAAIQEIASKSRSAADRAQEAAAESDMATEQASAGDRSIQHAVTQMAVIQKTMGELAELVDGLGTSTHEIGQISGVITAIAEQTNLLALNAAIEAARAGEHGRGFAVVADEVRKLAEQSAQSAQKINQLIASIQQEAETVVQAMAFGGKEVTQGIQIVNEAGHSFQQIQQTVKIVAAKIQEVSATSEQMSKATSHVVHAVSEIASIASDSAAKTQNVSAASEQQLASMQEITLQAQSLSNISEQLQALIGKFRT